MRGAIPPLPQYVLIVWCLVKHRDSFTFTFYKLLYPLLCPPGVTYQYALQGNMIMRIKAALRNASTKQIKFNYIDHYVCVCVCVLDSFLRLLIVI
jgi:hypothetical protein